MIKKTILLSSLVLAVAFLSGCGKKTAEQNNGGTAQKEDTGGIVNSIKDAIGMGKKMQCTYTYKSGDESFTTTAYIEGQKYKGESEVMGKKQIAVFDGETMYSWSEADKKGTKFTKSCMDELNKNKPEDTNNPAPDQDQIKSADEEFNNAMDVKCTPVASIDFSVPSDVTFTDMCEQLKKMQDMTKDLPKGVNIPENIPKGAVPESM
jgi:hypothetical protein